MNNKFEFKRTIYFKDTDAAGVVYFANFLSICHEAYEEYLVSHLKIDLPTFFNDRLIAIPIIYSKIDFLQPLFCGDRISVFLTPQLISDKVLETHYQIYKEQEIVVRATIGHICLNPQTRKTQPLPELFQSINY